MKRAMRSKRTNERCERTSERTSECPCACVPISSFSKEHAQTRHRRFDNTEAPQSRAKGQRSTTHHFLKSNFQAEGENRKCDFCSAPKKNSMTSANILRTQFAYRQPLPRHRFRDTASAIPLPRNRFRHLPPLLNLLFKLRIFALAYSHFSPALPLANK